MFSRVLIVLLLERRGGWHAPRATVALVCQPFQTRVHKTSHPLVDKTSADADRRGNVGDRHPISQEENNPAPSGMPRRDGRRPLPRQQCLPFHWREVDREGGFASTRHTETSQKASHDVACR